MMELLHDAIRMLRHRGALIDPVNVDAPTPSLR